MRCLLAVGVVTLSLALVHAGEGKTDKDKLQGTWRPVAGEQGGRPDPDAKEHTLTFSGDKFAIKRGDQTFIEGTFVLDPTKKPKAIDMNISGGKERFKGKTARGIYAFAGDELKWCVAEPGTEERPTDFKTAGTNHLCVTFKREKP